MLFPVGFGILTAVVLNSSIFWDITTCSPVKVNWLFRGTCRLHLQGRRISQARNQCESRWQAAWLILRPWRWRRHVPQKRRLNFNGLHDVISQKTELFMFNLISIFPLIPVFHLAVYHNIITNIIKLVTLTERLLQNHLPSKCQVSHP
jgi:hypothetical protein